MVFQNGYTVILVPRQDAVFTKAIKTAYSSTAGTAYVTFDGARAPVANTLGKVGNGMQVVLSNFNHERWMIVCTSLAAQRRTVEECLKWTTQRVAFGKPLNAQPVVRARLAQMIARIESGQNWLEFVTHQMNNVSVCFDAGCGASAHECLGTDVVRRAIGQDRRLYWPPEAVCHSDWARDRRRRHVTLWWTWYHRDGHGQTY